METHGDIWKGTREHLDGNTWKHLGDNTWEHLDGKMETSGYEHMRASKWEGGNIYMGTHGNI